MSQEQQASRSGKPDPSLVQVFAYQEEEEWQFHMHQDGKPVKKLRFSKDDKKLNKSDWHDVTFVLDEPTNSLQFHPDPQQAIWVARGTKNDEPDCPDEPSYDHGFYAKGKPEPKRLLVCNNNDEEGYLSYRLNFVTAGSSDNKIVAFHDPVVGNKNGGTN